MEFSMIGAVVLAAGSIIFSSFRWGIIRDVGVPLDNNADTSALDILGTGMTDDAERFESSVPALRGKLCRLYLHNGPKAGETAAVVSDIPVTLGPCYCADRDTMLDEDLGGQVLKDSWATAMQL
jgi:hypothetical protein